MDSHYSGTMVELVRRVSEPGEQFLAGPARADRYGNWAGGCGAREYQFDQ